MSTENPETVAPKKRRGTSIPLLVGFVVLGAVGYLFGEKIMTYAFYLQEMMIAASGAKGNDLPVELDANGNPISRPRPTLGGAGPAAPGPGGPEAGGPDSGAGSSGSEGSDSGSAAPAASAPATGAPATGAPAVGGGAPDPEAMFAQRDKDSNGKLEGEEIGERMQSRLSEVDTDNDKAISKEEFLTAWRNRQSAGSSASGGSSAGTSRPPSDNESK